MQIVPFFALPYRLESGGIRFFCTGWGWYFRDEIVFLKRWLETFAALGACVNPDGSPRRLSKAEADRLIVDPFTRRAGYLVDLVEARLFYPGSDERPFAFVPEAFEKRKAVLAENERTGRYNIGEQVIKLGLNGLSGKVAQSIGGSETKPPGCYNVFYAGAIRAGTRRSIGEAALQAPHEIVQFCTDAVFSKVPLKLNQGKELGLWEREEIRGLLTAQSGIYSYIKKSEKTRRLEAAFARGETGISAEDVRASQQEDRLLVENKARGFALSSVDLEAIENRMELEGVPDKKRKMLAFREALLTKVPEAWRQAAINPDRSINPSPAIGLTLRTFMSAGLAVASRDRFDLIGRWADVPKKMNVHTPGPKRRLLDPEDCDGDAERVGRMYWSIDGDAARCHELVPTAPARPEGDTWGVMSRPHIPKWYEGEAQLDNDWVVEEDLESEEIAMGDQ
jgi:hypothetical protein